MAQNEEERLDALHQLDLLDTPPSASFDRITRMAAQIFDLPISAVSLTDRNRQWFKSRVGVQHDWIPREKAPCAQVAEDAELLVIPDLLADSCYVDSHLARSGIRFYAGAPLVTREGFGLGSLCVLGTAPRQATGAEIAALTDLADIVMAQIEMQHAFGRIDPLSGLPNKTQFVEDANDLGRDFPGQPRHVFLLDLGRNDQIENGLRVIGPSFTDTLVLQWARAIRKVLDPRQKAYHVAATQFAVLSPPDVEEGASLEFVRENLAAVQGLSGVNVAMSAVVGIAPIILGKTDPRDALRAAFGAVQDARKAGDTVGFHSPSKDCVHMRRFELLNAFGAAMDADDQLRLVYQPRMDLASSLCVGAEALLRWTHPSLGAISPAEFIPIIELTALARPATEWVLNAAMRQLSDWRKEGFDFHLSINVSAANLEETDFSERVRSCLARHGLAPEMIEIEITEGAVMEKGGQALSQLQKLNAAGVELSIDDFGTGYSSLSYLQTLPVHVVKIDKSFVTDMAEEARHRTLVRSMIALSRDLGFRVVAEGVETAAVVDILAGMGCEEAQGYHFAKPMEASDLRRWVQDRAAPTRGPGAGRTNGNGENVTFIAAE